MVTTNDNRRRRSQVLAEGVFFPAIARSKKTPPDLRWGYLNNAKNENENK